MDEKKRNKLGKRLQVFISSLFARKQKYLIISDQNPRVWYSNNTEQFITTEYEPQRTSTFHRIEFKDDEIPNLMKELFPLLSDRTYAINVNDFNKVFGQKAYDNVEKVENETVIATIPNKKKESSDVHVIAATLDDVDYTLFKKFFTAYYGRTLDHTESIDYSLISKSSSYLMNVIVPEYSYKWMVPILDGLNTISVNEYIKKAKSKSIGKMNFNCGLDGLVMNYSVEYEDDFVIVQSIHPISVWFPSGRV